MVKINIFSNTKFATAFSALNESLKHKNDNKFKKYLLNKKASYSKFNSVVTNSLCK